MWNHHKKWSIEKFSRLIQAGSDSDRLSLGARGVGRRLRMKMPGGCIFMSKRFLISQNLVGEENRNASCCILGMSLFCEYKREVFFFVKEIPMSLSRIAVGLMMFLCYSTCLSMYCLIRIGLLFALISVFSLLAPFWRVRYVISLWSGVSEVTKQRPTAA